METSFVPYEPLPAIDISSLQCVCVFSLLAETAAASAVRAALAATFFRSFLLLWTLFLALSAHC